LGPCCDHISAMQDARTVTPLPPLTTAAPTTSAAACALAAVAPRRTESHCALSSACPLTKSCPPASHQRPLHAAGHCAAPAGPHAAAAGARSWLLRTAQTTGHRCECAADDHLRHCHTTVGWQRAWLTIARVLAAEASAGGLRAPISDACLKCVNLRSADSA
jgi:hypothetical protein